MKHRFEKNMNIMVALLTHCHKLGAVDYHTDMVTRDGVTQGTIRCQVAGVMQADLDELYEELNRPRQKEIEQNFWWLSGENDTESTLTLVGMMVDEATVTYQGGQLTIVCRRVED